MLHEKKESDVEDHITNRFVLEKRLGRGAYGVVWRVKEIETKRTFALKKIFDAFRNETDSQRTYREICFLKEFSKHPCIIKLYDVIKSNNKKDIYLIFEHMVTDLDKVIRKGNLLEDSHRKYISYQICLALAYIHSANVVHRDLKPGNILINENCVVKVCDFGMARSVHSLHIEDDIIMTDYVATRWYRAPEILLASNSYSTKVDMWSFGCIIGEILKGKALFPGNSTLNQLDLILKYFPPCCKEDIQSIKSNFSVSIMSKQVPKIANIGQIKSFVGGNASDESMSLLVSLFKFNPLKRFSALQCLEHPYFALYRNKKMEILLPYDVVPPIHDGTKLTIEAYRKILFDTSQIEHLQCERRPREVKIEIKEDKQIKKEGDREFINGMF